jgi:opacity protein-like surface antigen
MKKLTVWLLVLFVGVAFSNMKAMAQETSSEPCAVKKFSLSVGAGMRSFSEQLYKDVYGSSGVTYNVDLGFKVGKSLEAFLHTDYFSKTGKLTYTKEETKLKIIPVELGARFLIKVGNGCSLFPYIGAGAGYYMYKEENFIGTVDDKKFGFFAEGGLRFYLMSSFFIDAKVKNVFLKVDSLQLGGFAFMGAIGISF